MKVSILIPVYNAGDFLEATLESALAQSHPDCEIIALDDGSTDTSFEILQRYAAWIRVERHENRGGCAARNALLDMAAADFIQYLDADDIIDPGKITGQLAFLQAHPDVDVVTDTMRLFYDDPYQEEGRFVPASSDWWELLIDQRIPYTTAALWRRSAIEAVGGWDESLPSSQEYDLYFRLLQNGRRIALLDLAMTRFRKPSRTSPPKRKPARSIGYRVRLLDRIEAHLREQNALTPPRKAALLRRRLLEARALWHIDRQSSLELTSSLQRSEVASLRPHPGLPRAFLLTMAAFGFRAAQSLADLARRRQAS